MEGLWKLALAGVAAVTWEAVALVLAQTPPSSDDLTPTTARETIVAWNRQWGKARVDYDRAHMEVVLSSDFYVQIGERRIARKDFIDQCSTRVPGANLARFDVNVLTVQRKREGGWIAVIAEKLEVERIGADGKPARTYSFWITRDSYRETDGKWLCTSSEAIGFENWQGKKPPFADW